MKKIKVYIKYICDVIFHILFHIIGIFVRVKKNRILFYSFTGEQYSCSPKYITEFLNEEHPSEYEMIWAFKDVEKFRQIVPQDVKCVKYQSLMFMYYHLSSKFIISNIFPYHLIPKKKNQIEIDTWHGGGAYKKAGLDKKHASGIINKANVAYWRKNISAFVSSSELFTKYFIRGGLHYTGEVLDIGLPRNDIFFRNYDGQYNIKNKVRAHFQIDRQMKIALYAPTWRDEQDQVKFEFDAKVLRKTLEDRFGGEWIIMTRMHRLTTSRVQGNIVDANDYPDMQELLVTCDILISDYSSSIWDYCLTKKPCFLYAYDLDKYRDSTNFYVDIWKWGFPIAETFVDMLDKIKCFDDMEFQEKMENHYRMLGGYDDGKACEKIYEFIREKGC